MNPVGLEAQKIGKQAEQRVKSICTELGLDWVYSVEADYKDGIDITIRGVAFQISATGKSPKSKKRDFGKEIPIYQIVAGEHLSSQEIIEQIYLILNYEP